jgi:hypothetical protein
MKVSTFGQWCEEDCGSFRFQLRSVHELLILERDDGSPSYSYSLAIGEGIMVNDSSRCTPAKRATSAKSIV